MYIEEFPAGLIKCMLLVAYLTDRAFLWCLCVLADWILDEVWLTAPDISPDIDALHAVPTRKWKKSSLMQLGRRCHPTARSPISSRLFTSPRHKTSHTDPSPKTE